MILIPLPFSPDSSLHTRHHDLQAKSRLTKTTILPAESPAPVPVPPTTTTWTEKTQTYLGQNNKVWNSLQCRGDDRIQTLELGKKPRNAKPRVEVATWEEEEEEKEAIELRNTILMLEAPPPEPNFNTWSQMQSITATTKSFEIKKWRNENL